MMAFSIYLLQLWLLTAILLGLHQQRKRLGIIPMTFVMSGLSALLTIAPIINVQINIHPRITLTLAGFVFVPLIVTAFLLVYVTEGAHIAQLLLLGIVSIILLSIIILSFLLVYTYLPTDIVTMPAILSESNLLSGTFIIRRIASLAGFTSGMITIVIIYQFVNNYLPVIPLYGRFGIALMGALWIDSVIFFLISGFGFSSLFSSFQEVILNKTVAIMSLILPISLYLNMIETVQPGERKTKPPTLSILFGTIGNLRNRLRYTQSRLMKSESRFRHLAQKILITQEEERSHLARELHDEAGQALTALKISLEAMLLVKDRDRLRDNLVSVLSLVDDTIDNIRLLARGLRPPELQLIGLNRTISNMCDEWSERSGLQIDYIGQEIEALNEYSDTIAITIYRILQEALTNIVRHANATKVVVNLEQKDQIITLSISDNGDGFDLSNANNRNGIGLSSMIERADLLNGTLEVSSSLNKGTQIMVQIPLEMKL